jgi:hypothetical protein
MKPEKALPKYIATSLFMLDSQKCVVDRLVLFHNLEFDFLNT